jgi:hypothetical protein
MDAEPKHSSCQKPRKVRLPLFQHRAINLEALPNHLTAAGAFLAVSCPPQRTINSLLRHTNPRGRLVCSNAWVCAHQIYRRLRFAFSHAIFPMVVWTNFPTTKYIAQLIYLHKSFNCVMIRLSQQNIAATQH